LSSKSRLRITIGTRSRFLSGRSRIRASSRNSLDNVPFDFCLELMIFDDGRVAPRPVAERSPCSFTFPCSPWPPRLERCLCITDSKRDFHPGWDSSLSSDLSFSCRRLSSYPGPGGRPETESKLATTVIELSAYHRHGALRACIFTRWMSR
jgi:hypothetical protein